jgi:hypothetical protein
VSEHVSIGRATRGGKNLNSWFVLWRQELVEPVDQGSSQGVAPILRNETGEAMKGKQRCPGARTRAGRWTASGVLILLGLGFDTPASAEESAGVPEAARPDAVRSEAALPDALGRFSPEQRAKLLAGEPIYEYVINDGDSGSPSGFGKASVLIQAPADRCFQTFCDFDRHPLFFPHITLSRTVVGQGTNDLILYREMSFPLKTVKFYIHYKVDPAAGRVDFELDKSRPADIRDSGGFFHFIPVDANTTLFDYGLTKAEPGMPVPGFVSRYLTSQDLPRVVSNYKKWLESGGSWKK